VRLGSGPDPALDALPFWWEVCGSPRSPDGVWVAVQGSCEFSGPRGDVGTTGWGVGLRSNRTFTSVST
jgi:hypothetical protein